MQREIEKIREYKKSGRGSGVQGVIVVVKREDYREYYLLCGLLCLLFFDN